MRSFLLVLVVAIVSWWPLMAANEQDTLAADETAANYQELTGKIGPYAVKMFLRLDSFSKGNEVGYYYYVKYPKNVFKLKLVEMVAINASGSMHVVLNEYTSKGVHSGTFDGQYECRGDFYAGTFTNSKGKQFKFKLE
ncbi:MAG: hypothetical protein J6S96_07055 [Muribaculaceae bacterium]|nr:hypothetical protein [Muribaculaceae bacterium]